MLEVGQRVDRYEVEAALGGGGMATVHRVRHTLLGSTHALKVLRADLLLNDEARARFHAEGRIQAQLRHPHIAAVTDLVAGEGIAGLVMELLEGRSLAEVVDHEAPLAPDRVIELMVPVIEAVAHAHAAGVIHRDLKPNNVFLCDGPGGLVRPVVLDFGVARVDPAGRLAATVTPVPDLGTRLGTLVYMSPEQTRDPGAVTARSDLFSLGMMLFELLTGELAVADGSDAEVLVALRTGQLADPHARLPAAAQGLADVVARALAIDPADRWPDALALRAALLDAVRGPGLDLPTAQAPAVRRPPPRRVTRGRLALTRWPGTPLEDVVEVPAGADDLVVSAFSGELTVGHRGRPVRHSHARLVRRGTGWTVEPHGRHLTTKLDGRVLSERTALAVGQILEVGEHVFRLDGL